MKKLLVVRNDKLGDLMLTLPAISLIKSSIPDISIDCLINISCREISSIYQDFDNIITDVSIHNDYLSPLMNLKNRKDHDIKLINQIKKNNYDYAISFFSTFRTGYILLLSGIKQRYAPATKLAQIFYNKKIKQNRSQSEKSEYEYNNDLARFFLDDIGYAHKETNTPYISTDSNSKVSDQKRIFLHPFTGGSSKTLSPDSFIKLCENINNFQKCKFILHCDMNDFEKCKNIEKIATDLNITTIEPSESLVGMCKNISLCDIFIAGSTGPLHVAAAMNKKTVGFYPSKTSSSSLRWKTVNEKSKMLSFESLEIDKEFIEVDINQVASEIYYKLLK